MRKWPSASLRTVATVGAKPSPVTVRLAPARGWSGQAALSCWTGQVGPTMVTPWTPLSSAWGGEIPLAAQADSIPVLSPVKTDIIVYK